MNTKSLFIKNIKNQRIGYKVKLKNFKWSVKKIANTINSDARVGGHWSKRSLQLTDVVRRQSSNSMIKKISTTKHRIKIKYYTLFLSTTAIKSRTQSYRIKIIFYNSHAGKLAITIKTTILHR